MTMVRMVFVVIIGFIGISGFSGAGSANAQEEAVNCAALTPEEAQSLLDANPTYATRAQLDVDNDGVACEDGETEDRQGAVDCTTLSAEEAQALLDADPTYANRALLDPDNDGIACEDEAPGRGGGDVETPQEVPTVGIGTAAPAPGKGLVPALLGGLAVVFAMAGWRSYRRA